VLPGDERLSACFPGEVKRFYERTLGTRRKGLFGARPRRATCGAA
jgi:hypothetical protein